MSSRTATCTRRAVCVTTETRPLNRLGQLGAELWGGGRLYISEGLFSSLLIRAQTPETSWTFTGTVFGAPAARLAFTSTTILARALHASLSSVSKPVRATAVEPASTAAQCSYLSLSPPPFCHSVSRVRKSGREAAATTSSCSKPRGRPDSWHGRLPRSCCHRPQYSTTARPSATTVQ